MANWKNKVIVVTGGSSGFGLAIAGAFADRGATAVLIARSQQRLVDAVESAQRENRVFDWVTCDVTDDLSVEQTVAEIMKRHQRIDVWVNNVGQSTRVEFEKCTVDDYRHFMETNLYSAIRCTLAVLSHLSENSGQIVNIGSLAAKTGWPNVAPYTVSKHALAAFNHQLRIEGPGNVNCLFVCPGPIGRSDAMERYQEQARGMDQSAMKPGAGVNLKGIDPNQLASKIVRYCELRKKELVVPWYTRILFSITQLSPTLGDFLLRKSKNSK